MEWLTWQFVVLFISLGGGILVIVKQLLFEHKADSKKESSGVVAPSPIIELQTIKERLIVLETHYPETKDTIEDIKKRIDSLEDAYDDLYKTILKWVVNIKES